VSVMRTYTSRPVHSSATVLRCSSPSSAHTMGRDGHGRVERVLGLAGTSVVEDALASRPARLPVHWFPYTVSVEHMFEEV
jgi:hypothetical protein